MLENEVLTYKSLSVILGRSVDALRHDVSSRRIPHIKLGNGRNAQVRFLRSEIETWLKEQRVEAKY